jgi:predicted dehydrogenase
VGTAPSRPVRFGLVGYGAWRTCHARAIQQHAVLGAVCAASAAVPVSWASTGTERALRAYAAYNVC